MKLFEIYNGLLESKRTELDGLRLLSNGGISEADADVIIRKFASADKSINQKNIPFMAYVYVNKWNTDIDNIIKNFNEHNKLEVARVSPNFELKRDGLYLGTKVMKSFKDLEGELTRHPSATDFVDTGADVKNEKPIFENDRVKILNGDSVGKCINYTQGGLGTGKAYSFCIGQPANTMYKSYRDDKASTFYFILDKTRITTNADGTPNLDDDLHIVVFDNTSSGIELTDAQNNTGNIAEFGSNVEGYIEYLRKKLGVPEKIINELGGEDELMPNRPKDEQEKYEDELLGHSNDSLEWFMALPFRYKSNYIGRGHRLTNDQFDYLLGR
jgi:hypothetical protein